MNSVRKIKVPIFFYKNVEFIYYKYKHDLFILMIYKCCILYIYIILQPQSGLPGVHISLTIINMNGLVTETRVNLNVHSINLGKLDPQKQRRKIKITMSFCLCKTVSKQVEI